MTTQQIPRIDVQARDRHGTRYARRLRQTGRLPAVIYGHKQDPVHVSVDEHELSSLLHHHAHLVEVVVDSTPEPCLIKQVQWNHLGSRVIHIDLARVDLTETVTVEVALELVGDAEGLKEAHAILERKVSAIEVECRATDIPESVHADVSGLQVGQSLTVRDLELPRGVTCTLDPETVLATIRVVAIEAEEEVEELAAAEGEPKVIGKEEPEKGEDEASKAE